MKKMVAAVLLSIALLVSCASSTVWSYPGWWNDAYTGRLVEGMTRSDLFDFLPVYERINKTVTGGVVYEQWVYRHGQTGYVFLYLEDGVLVGWQI